MLLVVAGVGYALLVHTGILVEGDISDAIDVFQQNSTNSETDIPRY